MIFALPAVLLFLALGLMEIWGIFTPGSLTVPPAVHSVVFIMAALTAVAGPIILRTMFVNTVKDQQYARENDFLGLQKKILWSSQLTPYIAFFAVVFGFPKFYAAAIVMMALYSLYYYYPSRKRIDFDRRIFRVRGTGR